LNDSGYNEKKTIKGTGFKKNNYYFQGMIFSVFAFLCFCKFILQFSVRPNDNTLGN
jgi:hypothetical protein